MAIISITEPAETYIKSVLADNPNMVLVVGYSNSGCSGHKYTFALCPENEVPIEVESVQLSNSTRVVIKPDSVVGLMGAVLDLHTENFGEQLVWYNPQVINSCGCGNSFQLPGEEKCK